MTIDKVRILLLFITCKSMFTEQEEMGLGFIAAYLRKHEYHVDVYACTENEFDTELINKFQPGLIGTVVYDINKSAIYNIYAQIRKTYPSIILCAGGYCPTLTPVSILEESKDIDVTIIGEGETAFLELADSISFKQKWAGIKGIEYRTNEGVIRTEPRLPITDMDILPYPSRDLLEQYSNSIAQLSTSRGCSSNCSFCVTNQCREKWIGRSSAEMADEMEDLYHRYGIRAFNIIDCSFEDIGVNKKRMSEFAQHLLDRQMNVAYYVQMKAKSYLKIDDDLIRLLINSGLSSVCLGIESGNYCDLDLYNKKTTVKQMEQAIKFFQSYGLNVDPGFINFNPYSSVETLFDNLVFLYRYRWAANISYLMKPCRIYNNTSLYNKIIDDGLDDKDNLLGYKFSNNAVDKLYSFLHSSLKSIQPLIQGVTHCASFDFVSFSCLKTIFRNNDNKIYNIICGYEKEHIAIRDEVNEQIYYWFLSLLQLADQGWINDQAVYLSHKYMNKGEWKFALLRYASNKNKLINELSECNLDREIQRLVVQLFPKVNKKPNKYGEKQ